MSGTLRATFILFGAIVVLGSAPLAAGDDPPPAVPSPAEDSAATPEATEAPGAHIDRGDRVGVGQPVRVKADEVVLGDVVGIGTRVIVEGVVHGDVVGVGSRVEVRGEVRGDVVSVGSDLTLTSESRIGGEVVNVFGRLDNENASVDQVVNISPGFAGPALGGLPLGILGFFGLWWKLLMMALVFIVLLLHTALVPDRVRVIADETPVRPVVAFLVGLLAYAALFVVSVFLAVTLVGIPLVVILYFVFKVLQWLGLAGIFHFVGRRIGLLFGRDLSTLGAVLLGFLPFAILRFLPFCIGWFAWFVLGITAIGFVVLTRAGIRGSAAPGAGTIPPPAPPPSPPTPEVVAE